MSETAYSEPKREGSVGVEALASLPKNQLLHLRKNNSPYYILKAIESFLYDTKVTQLNNNFNTELVLQNRNNLKKEIGYIYSNNNCHKILNYFFENGAATALILMKKLNLTEMICYHALKHLVSSGIILQSREIKRPKGSKGGPKALIYQAPDAIPDQIAKAEELNERLCNPRYISAIQYAQLIMDDYVLSKSSSLTEGQIIAVLKGMKVSDIRGMCDLVCLELRKMGKPVWRSGV